MSDELQQHITVLYSCPLCSLIKVPCSVPARRDEDVSVWMDSMAALISADHHERSPHCHPKVLSEVYIPIQNTDKIGGPAIE